MSTTNRAKKFDTKETTAARIPISEMVVDEYQGHVNWALVYRIAKNWDQAASGAVILNLREDMTYAVLDGQHRVLAAQQANIQELNALVFIGKTREEEARLFVQLNTKHNVSAFDRFKAALFSGSVPEKNVRRILGELGLEVRNSPKAENSVRCVTILMNIYADFGPTMLKQVMGTLQSAFHKYNESLVAYSGPAVWGTAQFFHRYPEASTERLIDKMRSFGPKVIAGMGEFKKERGQEGWVGWGLALTSIYNKGYRVGSRGHLPLDRWTKIKFTPAAKVKAKAVAAKNLRSGKLKVVPKVSTEDYRMPMAAKTAQR